MIRFLISAILCICIRTQLLALSVIVLLFEFFVFFARTSIVDVKEGLQVNCSLLQIIFINRYPRFKEIRNLIGDLLQLVAKVNV